MAQSKSTQVGSLRASQVITTYGPGAFVDLPEVSIIVASLDTWPPTSKVDTRIQEPRLARKLQGMAQLKALPGLRSPPPLDADPASQWHSSPWGIGVRRFPKWFVVQAEDPSETKAHETRREMVELRELDSKGRFRTKRVVATRFVRACPKGHVDDVDWRSFVHQKGICRRRLSMVERGTSGDLSDIWIRCECGASRRLGEATKISENPLGNCPGERPWMGPHSREQCTERSRLLIRTATNAYFPQIVRVLSIPQEESQVDKAVAESWDVLQRVQSTDQLETLEIIPRVAELRERFSDQDLIGAIRRHKQGGSPTESAKNLEVRAFLNAREGYGDGIPLSDDFYARILPDSMWKTGAASSANLERLETVVQVHRLREVSALAGFTRIDAVMPDIHGEYESQSERAELTENPTWFPAVENRGEGVFVALDPLAVQEWASRRAVIERIEKLESAHALWLETKKGKQPHFPGGEYILLHTLSHLLMQSVAIRCGYPATAIRERIYLTAEAFGILLYTAAPDAEGTLGGLVQQASDIGRHLQAALTAGALCSSDPICAQHDPKDHLDQRWLHGAACHNCCLIAETSCEMRNEYLDRALVVPTLAVSDAGFFESPQ